MSIYRRLILAVATLGLATSVFAADEAAATTTTTTTTETTAAAPAAAEATPAATTEQAAAPATASVEKVDLNKADAKDLMKVKGMTAAKAKAIVSYRKKHGDFKAVEDLKEVKGFKKMNEKKMQEITEQLTIG